MYSWLGDELVKFIIENFYHENEMCLCSRRRLGRSYRSSWTTLIMLSYLEAQLWGCINVTFGWPAIDKAWKTLSGLITYELHIPVEIISAHIYLIELARPSRYLKAFNSYFSRSMISISSFLGEQNRTWEGRHSNLLRLIYIWSTKEEALSRGGW